MDDDYVDSQDSVLNDVRISENCDGLDSQKEFIDVPYEDNYDDDDMGNGFRGGRGRGNFNGNRGRGPPPGWMSGPPPPLRFRGRGYGPGGPPMRGRGFFRGRGGPRGFGPNNGPNFENNWGPMGPPPPGMMGGPPPFGPPPGMMPGGPMGPPPNMMGQPPPFGGPPGMPPPNMPAPEMWVETKSEEGKSYYYHSRTRETTWTRPAESPACKVITQAEMEAIVAGQMPGMGGPGSMPMMGGPMMGGPPMGMNNMPPNLPPYMTQPPPWVKESINKDKLMEEESPTEQDDLPPGDAPTTLPPPSNGNMLPYQGSAPALNSSTMSQPPNLNQPNMGQAMSQPNMGPGMNQPNIGPGMNQPNMAPGMNQNNMPNAMQQGPPPNMGQGGGFPGAWGGWGGWPPPLGQPAPQALPAAATQPGNAAQNLPNAMQSEYNKSEKTPPKEEPETTEVPAELSAAAAEWSSHRAPDGRPYYYHASRQESVWEKPKPLKQLEELQKKLAENAANKLRKDDNKIDIDESKIEVIDVEAHAEAAAAAEAERLIAEHKEKQRLKEQQEKEKEKEKKQDKNMLMSTTPISGTPWCVVWTGDGRVFFHNPSAHSSVWERPAALIGRADVDRAVSQPPAALLHAQRKEAGGAAPSTPSKATNGDLKRAADSDSEDSDPEPAKKAKPEEGKKAAAGAGGGGAGGAGTISAGAEAAREAEARAARSRALVPLEARLAQFRDMLRQRDVSAFSTWEKELHKIVFDTRYLLLATDDRKREFEKYVRERAEEERKEKKNRLLQKKEAFKALMEEAKLHSKSSFTDFSSKYARDDRFKGIEKPRDRQTYFNEHIADVRRKEKEEKEKKREQVKIEFIAMLKEKAVDRHARWIDVKKKIDTEPRYKAVDSSSLKEDYFREYCKMIKEERKKEKDRERSSKKEKKDKDRDKEKEKEKKEEKEGKKEKKKEKGEANTSSEDVSATVAETEAETEEANSAEVAREKEARAQASIKEREREVQRALATSLRDRDKEREYHKRGEAVQHFNALLADLVRNPELTWREAKKQLKKDHRYSLAELLAKEDKERLFTAHTNTLSSKRRDKLRALLTELGVTCTHTWKEVNKMLAGDVRAPVYCSSSQMEREFRDYQRDKQSAAKTALRQLLQETRGITHRSLQLLHDNPKLVQDLLQHDARYLALDHIPEERSAIVLQYLQELEKKGPPPPPTATEPSRRSKQ